jgi:hypothetical protein
MKTVNRPDCMAKQRANRAKSGNVLASLEKTEIGLDKSTKIQYNLCVVSELFEVNMGV